MAYLITLETDPGEEHIAVTGIRHMACAERTDCGGPCNVMRTVEKPGEDDGHECWGCDGWLDQPPMTEEETTALHFVRDEENPLDTPEMAAAKAILATYDARRHRREWESYADA